MLYIMLYNPFGPARALPTRLPTPLCPWCACLCSAGFIRHQTRQWLCLPHQKPPFLPAQPLILGAAPAQTRRRRAEPLRRRRLEGGTGRRACWAPSRPCSSAVQACSWSPSSWSRKQKPSVPLNRLRRSWRCTRSWKEQGLNRVLRRLGTPPLSSSDHRLDKVWHALPASEHICKASKSAS